MAFSYDAEHQMKTVDISKNGIKQSYQYAYDPFGRRISKTDSFNTTHFIWDGNRLLSETRGSQTKTYVYEQDGFVPVAQLDEQGIQYYHTDHLGTPRELTNSDGDITWEATYQTWGNTLKVVYQPVEAESKAKTDTNTENELAPAIQPLRFQGQYFDEETGLHYNRFRFFDPDIGRFISQDPIGLDGGNNLYQYAPSPVSWIDPLGLARELGSCRCPDDCEKLYKKIARKSKGTKATSGARGLEERIEHLHEDKADLYNKARTINPHTFGNLAGMGTWDGHVKAAKDLKRGLKFDIDDYKASGCNSKYKKLPGKYTRVAEMSIPNKPGY